MSTSQFVGSEPVTAMVVLETLTGEQHSHPIVIGHYGEHGAGEVWLEQEGARIGIPAEHVNAVIRQLRRTQQIAVDTYLRKEEQAA